MNDRKKARRRVQKEYYTMVFPKELAENECIELLFIDEKIGKTKYAESFEEYNRLIEENMGCEVFNGLSTVIKAEDGTISGRSEFMKKRQVLFFDFDLKDFPKGENEKTIAKKFKKTTGLFIHAIVDSGHGYHFYVCIEPADTEEVAEVNHKLAELVGADLRAAIVTQKARVPATINHKDRDKGKDEKCVTVICSNTKGEKFRRYTIQQVKEKIDMAVRMKEREAEIKKKLSERKKKRGEPLCNLYCIKKMVENGADKGNRNQCLCFLVNAYRESGYSKEKTLEQCLKFNSKCRPPKSEKEIKNDFNKIWEGKYKMFKCIEYLKTTDRRYDVLDAFCCREECAAKIYNPPDRRVSFRVPYAAFDESARKHLNGYAYAVLSVICREGEKNNGVTIGRLKQILTGGNKSYMCEKTFYSSLKKLNAELLIVIENAKEDDDKIVRCLGWDNDVEDGLVWCAKKALAALIQKKIHSNDYKVYLMSLFRLKNKMSLVQDSLSEWAGINKSTISKCLKNLEDAKLIMVNESYTESGRTYKYYSFVF